MKKVKKIVLLLVAVLTVVGLNVFYNDEKSYEYKNNNFLAQEVTSTECDNVLPTDKSCIKKGTKTTDELVKVGEEEVDSCTAGETAGEKVECSEKYYYKTDYTRSWVDGTKTCNWISSNSNSCSGSSTAPSNPSEGDSYTVCSGKYYSYVDEKYTGCQETGSNVLTKTETDLNTCTPSGSTKGYVECEKTEKEVSSIYIGCSMEGYHYDSSKGVCVNTEGKGNLTPSCTGGATWNATKKTCVFVRYTKRTYTWQVTGYNNCSTTKVDSGTLSSCTDTNPTQAPNVVKRTCSGPYYSSIIKYTYTCDGSAGYYTEWSPKTPTKVNSCTATTGSTTKTECSSAKYTKTTYKKGTVEVCEQCVVRTPDTELPVVKIESKNCENGSCIINAKLTDNVGVIGFAYSKNSNDKEVSEWISLGGSYTEQIVEIKNVKETQETGTYYVFAKDEAGNIGKAMYTITSQDLDKETLLDLSLSLAQEDMIIKNKIKITNNSTLSFNACNVVVEVPIDSNVTLIEDSISTSSLDTSVVEIKVEKNKIIFTINKILEVNENIEITFNTKLKNSNVKKVVLEPSVTYYETKEKTCNKDTESDKVISLKKDINIEIVNNVPNTGKSTPLFIVLGVSVVAIGTGLVYNILKKSKYLVK